MTNMFNRFASKGVATSSVPGKTGGIGARVVVDNRKPIYIVFILDKSGSMNSESTIIDEAGEAVAVPKIDQLNEGVKRVIKTLKKFEAVNPLYRVYLQIIELDSYGKAEFPEFQPVSRGFEEIKFEAEGCTELRASLYTLKTFISHKYLRDDRSEREGKGYNKAVSVILMSDGWPTDSNGFVQSQEEYRAIIDEFNEYLRQMDYARTVDKYSIAVGDDSCEDMLRYFCDGDEDLGEETRFYRVEACESIASALDFMTRASLAHHTTVPVADDLDDEDDDEYEEEDEGYEEDDDEYEEDDDEYEEDGDDDEDDDSSAEKFQIDIIKCRKDRCMECVGNVCPVNAIEVHSGIISINDSCTGCGQCQSVCRHDAIHKTGVDDASLDELFDGID